MNELNIEVFDYIFCTNTIQDSIINFVPYINELNDIIKEKLNTNSNFEFWNEYESYVSNNTLKNTSTLSGLSYSYFPFPMLTLSTTNNYLKYKLNQFKKLIDENPNYNFNNIMNDLNISNEKSLKKVIDYLINNRVIIKVKDYAKENILGKYDFEFENLEININLNEERKTYSQIVVNNNGQMAYSYNGNATININQDNEKLFEVVLSKIEAMKAENVPIEMVEELIKFCNEKKSNKVIELLQALAIEVSSSLVVKGILAMFGIPC